MLLDSVLGYDELNCVQEIANSYVDKRQEPKERRDVIAREKRRLEKRTAEKARTESVS